MEDHATSRTYPAALSASGALLRVLVPLNIVFGVLIFALLVVTFVSPPLMAAVAGERPGASPMLIPGLRLLAVIGLCAIPLAHVLYTRLLAIVRSVRAANPFVPENAVRLQTIAWALLGLQLLHLAAGAVAWLASSKTAPVDIDWNFSVTGWLAVLLVFVLARVFDHGTKLREDLEGTV